MDVWRRRRKKLPICVKAWAAAQKKGRKKENKDGHMVCGWAGAVINRSPIAPLCMIVNWSQKQGSGPEGDEVL